MGGGVDGARGGRRGTWTCNSLRQERATNLKPIPPTIGKSLPFSWLKLGDCEVRSSSRPLCARVTFLPVWCWKEEGAGPSDSLPSPPRTWCSVPVLKAKGARALPSRASRRRGLSPGRRPSRTPAPGSARPVRAPPPPGSPASAARSPPGPAAPQFPKLPPPSPARPPDRDARRAPHLVGSWAGPGRQLLPWYPTCWRRPRGPRRPLTRRAAAAAAARPPSAAAAAPPRAP